MYLMSLKFKYELHQVIIVKFLQVNLAQMGCIQNELIFFAANGQCLL